MTPDDIRSQRFNTRLLKGLSPEEVGAFLEDVAEAFADLQDLNGSLTAQVEALEEELQARAAPSRAPAPAPALLAEVPAPHQLEELRSAVLKEVEAMLHNAHVQVNTLLDGAREREVEILREAEAVKALRQAEAEELLAAATARAEALVVAARDKEAEIRDEIDRLAARHLQVVDDIRATLDAYHQWLTTVDPRGRARGRRETREGADDSANGLGAASESTVG
jgi:DivIVA domain-containing protein